MESMEAIDLATAYINDEEWNKILNETNLKNFHLTAHPYNEIVDVVKLVDDNKHKIFNKNNRARSKSKKTVAEKPKKENGNVSDRMSATDADPNKNFRVYKLVLTGGPCGGKTTGQERLATFFENMGWKVFTVPETATVLLRGGVKFSELNSNQTYSFQKDLLLTLLQIEKVFFNQADLIKNKDVLIICDRGAMDPSAYMDVKDWEKVLRDSNLNMFDLRDDRYNQIVHMVTAADGAESYYTLKNNSARSEGIKEAIEQDRATRNAWIGHPYVDIVNNTDCRNFNDKILQLIQLVCDRIGLPPKQYQDRLAKNSKKRKWLVKSIDLSKFPKYEEFTVRHDYLLVDNPEIQVRIRKRKQNNRSTYTLTTRRKVNSEQVETKMQLTRREYLRYRSMIDPNRVPLHKVRRCFNFGNQYFNLDSYVEPLPVSCKGDPLTILETYTTKTKGEIEPALPDFIQIDHEITGEAQYSMYMLARKNNLILTNNEA